jgi:hypothetical protein
MPCAGLEEADQCSPAAAGVAGDVAVRDFLKLLMMTVMSDTSSTGKDTVQGTRIIPDTCDCIALASIRSASIAES